MIKSMTKKMNNKKGFTLIELIVVIAILGILAAIAIPRFSGIQKNASISADVATATTIINAAKVHAANENMVTDAAINAIDIAALTDANLIDAPGETKTTEKAFVLKVTGGVDNPVYTVNDGTDTILPTATGAFDR